jgi:hypothetical protein
LPISASLDKRRYFGSFGGVPVRVIDATRAVTASAGRYASDCRLVTTLTDAARFTTPDRASFTIALNTARDHVIQAAGVIADTTIDLAGRIGRLVLASLMPAQRLRIGPLSMAEPRKPSQIKPIISNGP